METPKKTRAKNIGYSSAPAADMKRAIGVSTSFHCYAGSCQAPRFCLACPQDRSRQKPYRNCPRRRRHLRHPAFPLPRTLVAAPRHFARRPSALHLKHHLRNLPLPGRPDAARHRPRRRSGFAAVPGRRRSSPRTSPLPPAASTNCAKPGSTRPSGSIGSSPRKRKKPASPNARSPNPATKPTSRSAP